MRPAAPAGGAEPDFDRKLADLLSRVPVRDFVVGGKISLLDIDAIRDRLGARWPALEDRVHVVIRETLRKRLDTKDMFTRYRDSAYLIVFSAADAAQAKLKSLLIAREIATKLFGESDLGQNSAVRVDTVVAKVDGEIARQSIDVSGVLAEALAEAEAEQAEIAVRDGGDGQTELTSEQVLELLGEAERSIEALEQNRGPPEDPVIVGDRLQQILRRLREMEEVFSADDKTWTAIPAASKPLAPATVAWKGDAVAPIELVQNFIRRGDTELTRRRQRVVWVRDDETAPAETPAEVAFTYLPVWNARQNTIALYMCHAAVDLGGLRFIRGALAEGEADPAVIDTLDRLTLRQAKTALQDTVARNLASMIAVPVHFSSLIRLAAREQYLRICHAIPEWLRPMLVWELVRTPPGSWKLQLGPALAPLRGIGRTAFLRLDPSPTGLSAALSHLEFLPAAGIRAVGLDLGAVTQSEAAATESLTALAKCAGRHGLACYATGLTSPVLVKAAAQLRFDHLAGPVIAAPVEAPQGVIAKPLADLETP